MKLLLLLTFFVILDQIITLKHDFNSNFKFGVATSAYQIEGAATLHNKTPSIWDYFCHHTNLIKDNSTGDIACDSYHRYREDVKLLKELGVKFYRFSLSWTRLLPNGIATNGIWSADPYGVEYYRQLIDELIANNIEPAVTLFHFDLPLQMAQYGGFQNASIISHFERYADVVFALFGHKVKHWFTINEPNSYCEMDVLSTNELDTEYTNSPYDVKIYTCARNLLLSHATVYRLYERKYKWKYYGFVSLVIDCNYFDPGTDLQEDIDATERYRQFIIGKWGHPIYHGDFPQIMKDSVNNISMQQGLPSSKLPKFTPREIWFIKGTNDYFCMNFYTSRLVYYRNSSGITPEQSTLVSDAQVRIAIDPKWKQSSQPLIYVTPKAFRGALKFVQEQYNNPEILVTENGYGDYGERDDIDKIDYIKAHLEQMILAMNEDHVRVFGYTVWSLMDNFEWTSGYTSKFGLYAVDFNSSERLRSPRASAKFYQQLIATRIIPKT